MQQKFVHPRHRIGVPVQNRITFTLGSKTTTVVVRPALMIAAGVVCVLLTLSYLGATAYWLMRDDMTATATAERKQLETYYQDRIDLLKTEIERLSSRQLVDRETVELKVSDLVRRQQALNKRHAIVTELMARAKESGIQIASKNPIPAAKPRQPAEALLGLDEVDPSAMGGEAQPVKDPVKALGLRADPESQMGTDALKPSLGIDDQAALNAVDATLDVMGQESTAVLDALAVAAEIKIDRILAATRPLGVSLSKTGSTTSSVGGPFVPLAGYTFDHRVERIEQALSELRSLKNRARRLPVARPIRGARISSHFGPRVDPFLKRLAMHTGMDFKAQYGSRVYSSAPGTVTHAGRKGGYGKLVEIRHAGGFTTRYAHLSRLQVSEGDHVVAGDVIGNVGSTGRSTGPHLHYEIRRSDNALDPAAFVTAGDRLSKVFSN